MTLTTRRDGRVLILSRHRPEARNAMDPESAKALYEALLAYDADPEADCAVLYGEGGAFCAGWDLAFAQTLTDRARFESEVIEPHAFPGDDKKPSPGPMGPTRLELSKPVIAAIEGPAVAGGMEIALWCDLRVMAEDAYFGVYCRRWGIPLVDGGAVRLPRMVGLGRALDIILTGRKVPAEEAERIGLCERIVPRGEALDAAIALAHELVRFPQAALRADRRTAFESGGHTLREAMRREWAGGIEAHFAEGAAGAARFKSGKGRHGGFDDI
ncbi:MAG: crotonase/enoyl-CoA hydratase family protein [Pseudomonadota bacterium]